MDSEGITVKGPGEVLLNSGSEDLVRMWSTLIVGRKQDTDTQVEVGYVKQTTFWGLNLNKFLLHDP